MAEDRTHINELMHVDPPKARDGRCLRTTRAGRSASAGTQRRTRHGAQTGWPRS